MTYGESEALKQNALLFGNNIHQNIFKEDLTTFSFLNYSKNLLIKQMPRQRFVQTTHLCCFAALLLDFHKDENRGKGLWNFNNSLSMKSEFVNEIKYHIKSTLETSEKDGITDFQAR